MLRTPLTCSLAIAAVAIAMSSCSSGDDAPAREQASPGSVASTSPSSMMGSATSSAAPTSGTTGMPGPAPTSTRLSTPPAITHTSGGGTVDAPSGDISQAQTDRASAPLDPNMGSVAEIAAALRALTTTSASEATKAAKAIVAGRPYRSDTYRSQVASALKREGLGAGLIAVVVDSVAVR